MSLRELLNLRSTCKEGPYWANRSRDDIQATPPKRHKAPEHSIDEDDDEEEAETSNSVIPPATLGLACAQQRSPPSNSKGFPESVDGAAFAAWVSRRPFTYPEEADIQPGSVDSVTYITWLTQPPFASPVAVELLLSDYLEGDLREVVARELQDEWKRSKTDFEALLAILDQRMVWVVKEMRDGLPGVRGQHDNGSRQHNERGTFADFRQRFGRMLNQERLAHQSDASPERNANVPRLSASVHGEMRKVVEEAVPGVMAEQDEFRANGRRRGSTARGEMRVRKRRVRRGEDQGRRKTL